MGRGRSRISEALKFQPNVAELHLNLGLALSAQQKQGEVESEYREALRLDPDNALVLNNLGYHLLQEDKNLEEALSMIQRAVAAEPSNSSYLDSLGWAYFKLNKLDEAERFLSDAVRLNGRLATAYEHLGDVYMKRGQTSRAREAWKKALSLPEDELNQKSRLANKLKG
jgi:Tfp pilus assembly protein PilF